jgi:hypothetical protein
MLKRTTAATIAILIAMVASPVAAQTCTLGVYGDADGTSGFVSPIVGEVFDAYVVMFYEGLANGVGYTLLLQGGQDLLPAGSSFGEGGIGLNIPNDTLNPTFSGANVGLGQCAIGFNGNAIVVARYSFVAIGVQGAATFSLTGNARSSDLDPAFPVFSDCLGVIQTCDVGPALTVETPVSGETESFGAVKSLYRN